MGQSLGALREEWAYLVWDFLHRVAQDTCACPLILRRKRRSCEEPWRSWSSGR
jgi:hypothetical protein